MRLSLKRSVLAAAVLPLAFTGVASIGATSAFAYGHVDNPIAQVEMSGNCDNASYCDTTPLGTGGFWVWAELDAASPTATSGTVDASGAGCGHTVGGPRGGAGGGPATGIWQKVSLAQVLADDAFPVDVAVDSNGNPDFSVPYYEITLDAPIPTLAVPAQLGHYSVSGLEFSPWGPPPPNGVSFQTEVAP